MPKSNLYTGTGDQGTTSLVGGTRIKKNCIRLESYGTIDEFSSQLGVILSNPDCPEEVRGQLRSIQNMLRRKTADSPRPGCRPECLRH